MYIGRKFKQDKKLKMNMQHTSINFKQWPTVKSKTKLWMALISLKNMLIFVNGRLVCLLETLRQNVNDRN